MWMLVLCVLCSVAVSVLFKWARPKGLQAAQAIAVNYLVAISATYVLLQPDISMEKIHVLPWHWVILLGVLLPTVFVFMAQAVYRAGMVRADAAQRLSLVIPLLAAVFLFGEHISGLKGMGVGLAVLAVLLIVAKPKSEFLQSLQPDKMGTGAGWMLFLVWMGYGVIDVIFKQVAKTGAQFSLLLLVGFVAAAVLIWGFLLLNKTCWHGFSLRCGLLLGMLNFANIYFYIKAHQALHETPSVVFAGVNVGVLSLATVIGVLAYKERLYKINVLGLLVALVAVMCLYASMI